MIWAFTLCLSTVGCRQLSGRELTAKCSKWYSFAGEGIIGIFSNENKRSDPQTIGFSGLSDVRCCCRTRL